MATNITISTGGSTTVVTVPETQNNVTVSRNQITTDERTKLAGIEAGATADQTAAEIKTAYESNSDTNAFTDSEKSKLAGISSGAGVTSSATVSASGAVMTTGDQTVAGNKTFSGTTTLSGTTLLSGSVLATSGLQITNSDLTFTGSSNLSVSGTSNFTGAATFSEVQAQSLVFVNNGTSIIAPVTSGALLPDDLEIRSNGNVTISLDYDNDESSRKI